MATKKKTGKKAPVKGKRRQKLTDRQELFCLEYIEDCNASAAALRAGYAAKGVNAHGARLIANDSIHERIKELMAERDEKLIARGDEVLKKLTAVLRREETETVVSREKTRRVYIDEHGIRITEEKETPVTVEIPAKLSDVVRAAESLGKRWGLWTFNVKHEGKVEVEAGVNTRQLIADAMSLDEMESELKNAAKEMGYYEEEKKETERDGAGGCSEISQVEGDEQ